MHNVEKMSNFATDSLCKALWPCYIQTYRMKKFKALMAAMMAAACLSANAADTEATIHVDSRVKFQHVTGFGGFSPSPTWQYWLNDSDMDKLFGKGTTQLGLNIVRLYISSNKGAWGAGVANARRAKKYGAFVFASPWTPPKEWKSNNAPANGGSLLESHYADWANYLNDYYKYMKGQGVEIDAVSIQNEPDWKAEYESCIWTGQQMAKFLREQGDKIECKIIAPEAIHFSANMHEPILNDDAACQRLDIMGGHFYGWNGSSYPLAQQKGKEVWMTEFLINERQQNNKLNINWKDDGFLFARSVNDAMLANMSAWVHYSLKRYYGVYGDGEFGTTNNAITKRGWILSHYAKYVSGTTRVRHALSDPSGKLTSSAYLSQTGDSIIVMLLNPSDNNVTTTFQLPFNTLGGATVLTTESSTKNAKKTALTLDAETFEPTLQVEPWSVNTFIFVKSSDRDDIPSIDEDDLEEVFADHFDLSGGGCIPAGWKATFENGTRGAGNYDSGPRIMNFSNEGLIPYAFYFRTGSSAGKLTYGEDTKNRLYLEPGSYTLSYSLIGWKVKPTITTTVKVGTKQVGKLAAAPKYSISTYGSASRITQSTDLSIDFEVATAGNCILTWSIPGLSNGLNECLLGNVRLVKNPDKSDEEDSITQPYATLPYDTTTLPYDPTNLPVIHDMLGRRILKIQHPGLYIVNGKKVLMQ